MTVYVVVRNEIDRRCVIGVCKSEAGARKRIDEDREELENLYDPEDYAIVPQTLED
jgi:hypothetical protein